MSIATFPYNNDKNTSCGHISLELNCNYNLHALFQDEAHLCSKFRPIDKPDKELRDLILICQQNLFHIQEL